jgi:hypothetical protein
MQTLPTRILVLLGIVITGMQFIPAPANTGSFSSSSVKMVNLIDPQVGAILDRSCQDCHSANTHWPWYSRIAPISWMVVGHVRLGRAKLNFSDWARHSHSRNERMEICDAVSNGTMPMKGYTLFHPSAHLTSQEIDRLCDWAASPDTSAPAHNPAPAIAPATN